MYHEHHKLNLTLGYAIAVLLPGRNGKGPNSEAEHRGSVEERED